MAYFTSETFRFLRELAENNERPWFQENRDRYERFIRAPAQRFIVDIGERLDSISPHLRADPRPSGGSLFRIHRDVRFSKDKSPYKTTTGIQFRHARGKDAHAPGLYLHIEPRNCFIGLGVWHPAGGALRAIREAIAEDSRGWNAVVGSSDFEETFELGGESLTRVPRGFDPDHPLAEDLRRKDFIAYTPVPQSFVTGHGLVEEFLGTVGKGREFVAWLCKALNVPF